MKKIFSLLLSMSILFTSCESFFDVNTDPNNPATAPYDLVLPAAVSSSAVVIGGQYAILGSLWSQHFTQCAVANQYKLWDSYKLTSSDFNGSFNELYSGGLNDYNYVLNETEVVGDWNTYLMATVMRCYTFQVLVDLYGEIPYSDAFNGKTGNITPKWDKGDVVYDGLIKELDNALSKDFSASTNKNINDRDFIFGGDVAKWKQFANTLKLKIYLRQVNARASVAEAGIKSMLNSGVAFLSSDAMMNKFSNQPNKQNPLYGSEVAGTGLGNVNLVASATLYNYLFSFSDLRYKKIYLLNKTNPYNAQTQGDFLRTDANKDKVSLGNFVANQPVYFISAAESYFLQAEANARFGSDVKAKSNYDAGVTASFNLLGVDGADVLLADGAGYSYPSAGVLTDKVKAIITQKWISCALFNPIESFFEFNRTGYPTQFTVSVNTTLNANQFPQRLLFPTDEVTKNPNTPKEIAVSVPVWWAKK